jgi:hypothetical protein
MQRLEIMQQLALQAKADADGLSRTRKSGVPAIRRPERRRAQVIILAWFSFGVLASGAAGLGALKGLRTLEARGTPLTWASIQSTLGSTLASAWANMPSVPFRQRAADGDWERVEVKIDATRRQQAPLGLYVSGGDGRPVLFVLDGVPAGVRPSHGAEVAPGTWVVSSAEIGLLHLTLDQGAPSAFDLKIALLGANGVAKSGSVVEVRMVDSTAPMQSEANRAKTTEAGPLALAAALKKREQE